MSLATLLVGLVVCGGYVVAAGKLELYDDYVLLASDVQEWSQASSVFIIFGGNDESLPAMTLMQHLVHEFSSKDVLSLTANYTEILQSYKHYYMRIVRPLIVVLLSTEDDVISFRDTTQAYDMSYPQWLVIFMDGMNEFCERPKENIFNLKFDANMLVKCYGDSIVREWYSIYDNVTETFDLARWTPTTGLRLTTNKTMYQRRNSIGGKFMRIAMVMKSPFILSQSRTESSKGLYQQILEELSWAMNFTFDVAYKETIYGIPTNLTEGTWSGVIGRIVDGEADIGVAEMTMTVQRKEVVDFTVPLVLSRNRLYMQPPGGWSVQWSSYSRAFRREIWVALIIVLAVSAMLITFMRLNLERKPIPPGHVSENCLAVWSTFCQQGLTDFPTSSSLRIAYVALFTLSLILLDIYSACLISYLTLSIPSLPFNDLEGFVKIGTYQLLTSPGGADYNMFTYAHDPTLMKMRDLMKDKEHLPRSVMEGFQRACDQRKVAFHATEAVKEQLNMWMPCDLAYIDTGRFDSLGMVLTKGSPYTGVINYHLQKFKDYGIISRMKMKKSMIKPLPSNEFQSVGLMGIAPLIVVLLVGVAAGLVMFLGEKFVRWWTRRRSDRRIEGLKLLLVYEKG